MLDGYDGVRASCIYIASLKLAFTRRKLDCYIFLSSIEKSKSKVYFSMRHTRYEI